MLGTIKKRIVGSVVIATAGVLLAGCSTTASSTGGGTSASGAVEPLTLYAAEAYDSAVAKAFTAKTGIPVKVVDDSTGPLLVKVGAEKSNPQWSMLWVDGDQAFAALDKQGQLAAYQSSASLTSVGQALVPSDHAYTATGTTLMAAVIYNAARTSAVPTQYSDLLTAPYNGRVGMNDPAQSGPTYPLIAGIMNQLGGTTTGVQQGEAYFTSLKKNGLKVYPTNGDTLHALETGQIDYGIVQSSAAIGETLKVKATAKFQPKIVYLPKSTLLPGVIGIQKKQDAVKLAESKKFVDFALSAEGQKVMQGADTAGDSLYWPIVSGVSAISGMPALPTAYQRIDPVYWGDQQPTVVSWFEQNIK